MRGNITGWKKGSFSYINSWDFSSGLGTSLFYLELRKEITFLDIYGPYLDRVEYQDKIFSREWIQNGLVVVGGDLNFTARASEVWGPAAQVDFLSRYFINKIKEVGLLHIELAKLSPTWRNKRTREACIIKRLDHFLICVP